MVNFSGLIRLAVDGDKVKEFKSPDGKRTRMVPVYPVGRNKESEGSASFQMYLSGNFPLEKFAKGTMFYVTGNVYPTKYEKDGETQYGIRFYINRLTAAAPKWLDQKNETVEEVDENEIPF